MEHLHQPGDLINQRYRILEILGKGGISVTYKAVDEQINQPVAIKALSLRQTQDWKIIELFEREARVLQNLNHPAIPNYLDYFQIDTTDDRYFYIVQEVAEGQSLAEWIKQGWRPSETEVRNIAQQILDILIYLHEFNPPAIHRDIKPQNIIRQSDGKVYLVDFGAVKDTYQKTMTAGSTVVGTYGYMAPEQFRGQAKPATDLYGLAATLLFLLTRTSPADLPEKRLKLDFRPAVNISSDLADWLDKMLEPATDDRFQTAKEALAVLRGEREMIYPLTRSNRQPAGSKIKLQQTAYKLIVDIPPAGLSSDIIHSWVCFAVMWLVFIVPLTKTAISSGAPVWVLFSTLVSIVCLIPICRDFYSIASCTYLEINREKFRIQRKFLGYTRTVEGNTADLAKCKINNNNSLVNNQPVITCALIEGLRTHWFGSTLTQIEKEWLVREVDDFLTLLKKREITHFLSHSKRQQAGSKIKLQKTANKLLLDMPNSPNCLVFIVMCLVLFALFLLVVIMWDWVIMAIASGDLVSLLSLILFSIIALKIIAVGFDYIVGRTYLEINREKFRLQSKCLGFRRTVEGNTADLVKCEIRNINFTTQHNQSIVTFALIEDSRTHRFGSMLTQIEQEWFVREVNNFLAEINKS